MKLSSRAYYGLRALVDLALQYETGEPVQVKDIARRQDIPEDYLGQLMVGLRRSGLIESVRGPAGGYSLARPPQQITVAEALEALEGPLIDESEALSSPIQAAWTEAMRAALAVLRSMTLHDICQRYRLAAPMYYI